MDLRSFIDKCLDRGYEWAEGEYEGKDGIFIRSEKFQTKAHFTREAIEENDWPRLNKGIIQGRDVYHVTRVVGYFSKIHNWNKSKQGELADRHAGNYRV